MSSIKETPNYFYFKRSLNFLITNKIVITLHLFIEFLDLYVSYINQANQLFYYNKEYDKRTFKLIQYLTPYHYIREIHDINITSSISFGDLSIIIAVVFLALYFFLYYTIGDFNRKKMNFFSKALSYIYINFYDYLFFRTFAVFSLNAISHEFIKITNKSGFSITDLLLLSVCIILSMVFICTVLKYFLTFSIWSTFQTYKNIFNDYPFDNFISMKYDICLLMLKFIMTLSRNNLEQNGKIVSVFQIFINCLGLAILLAMGGTITYYFFFKKSELNFLSVHQSNMLRIFFIIFGCASIIMRLMFHNTSNYKVFTMCNVFVLLLIFIPFSLHYREYLVANAENSLNYLGVCWFLQSNKLDTTKFITQWILHHKNNCNNAECTIYNELFGEGDDDDNKLSKPKSPNITYVNPTMTRIAPRSQNSSKFGDTLLKTLLANRISKEFQTAIDDTEGTILKGNKFQSGKVMDELKDSYMTNLFYQVLIDKAMEGQSELNKEELIKLDFLYLNMLFLSNGNQHFNLFNTSRKLITKYQDNSNALLSFMLIFELIRKNNKELIQSYKLVRKSEDLKESIKKYINDMKKFIHLDMKTPENFLKISDKYISLQESTKVLFKLSKKHPETNYQLIILRYLFENILHTKIKGFHNDFDINYFEEFLDFHYLNDRLFLLKYSIDKKDFIFIKGSKKIMKFNTMGFDSLFPEFAKEKGQEIFEDQLKSNTSSKSIFEYIVKDLNTPEVMGYVQPFKMKYYVYPSNREREMLIQAHYVVDYTNVMIFETNSSSNEEYLFSMSSKLFRYFGLTPEMVQTLIKSEKFINFNSLFTKTTSNMAKTQTNLYAFNYGKYLRFYKNFVKFDALSDCAQSPNFHTIVKEIIQLGTDQKEIMFIVNQKLTIESFNTQYVVYHVREFVPKKGTNLNMKTSFDPINTIDFVKNNVSDISSDADRNDFEPIYKYDNRSSTACPSISAFSTESASISSVNGLDGGLGLKGRKNLRGSQKKIRYKQVSNFTIFIICFGLFLTIITLLFFILAATKNNTFQSLFKLFQTYRFYKRGVQSAPLSILSNNCYHHNSSETCYNYYKFYSEYMTTTFPDLKGEPLISEVIQEEIKHKFLSVLSTFDQFQKEIFTFNFKSINKINNLYAGLKIIIEDNGKFIISEKNISVVDMMKTYNNYIINLVTDNIYSTEPFFIIDLQKEDGRTLMVSKNTNKELTNTQSLIYLLLINFPFLNRQMGLVSDFIVVEFNSYLSQLKTILYSFSILLISLNIILCGVCIFFLQMFIIMLKANIYPALHVLTVKKFITYIDSKLSCLAILCELYEESPMKIINKIKSLEDAFRKDQKELHRKEKTLEMNSQKQEPTPSTNLIINEENNHSVRPIRKKDFRKIILNYRVLLIAIFFCYSVYLIGYFLFLIQNFNKLKSLAVYCNINLEIDNYIYDITNSLQYIKLTNSSSTELSEQISDNPTDYIYVSINALYSYIEYKEQMELINPKIFPPLGQRINLNCSEFQIDDSFMMKTLESLKGNYNTYLSKLCNAFPVSTYGNDNTVLREILYLTNQMYNSYKQGDFETLITNVQKKNRFDLYTISLIISRIQRTYFNEVVVTDEVNSIFGYFTTTIYIYLVLNIVLELVIFLILNFLVLRRIKNMSIKLDKFMHSLR